MHYYSIAIALFLTSALLAPVVIAAFVSSLTK